MRENDVTPSNDVMSVGAVICCRIIQFLTAVFHCLYRLAVLEYFLTNTDIFC